MSIRILQGDCAEVMKTLADSSVDAIVTDPPYGLGFMGQAWDHGVPAGAVWLQALRVLKPGGYLLAFAGTRTQHRMCCNIEDAGFEIRDMIAWVYSSGFPKSHNLDNLRGKVFCDCQPDSECEVRSMRDGDVSAAEHFATEHRQVLQSGVSEQSASQAMLWTQSSQGGSRGIERSVEGWGDAAAASGQLRFSEVCPGAGVGSADGAQGRLRDGAPAGDGPVVRVPADQDGSRAPCRPRSAQECAAKPGTVAGQQEPQDVGGRPHCDRCSLPILPRGLGTALKPALEPITVARKPLAGTVEANWRKHGTGALNIDACRVLVDDEERGPNTGKGALLRRSIDEAPRTRAEVAQPHDLGRWPANLIHDGSDEVLAAFPDAPGAQSPVLGTEPSPKTGGIYGAMKRVGEASMDSSNKGSVGFNMKPGARRLDSGSAARFFYCAKADRTDRNEGLEGLEGLEGRVTDDGREVPADNAYQRGKSVRQNFHPTVKPTDLMRYLCRLVTPAGGLVLDPFMGSGSTLKAAELEGFSAIGIELDPQYIEIARRRIAADMPLFAEVQS